MKSRLTMYCSLLIASFLAILHPTYAQRVCGAYENLQAQLSNDPLMQQRINQLEQFTTNFWAPGCARISNATITIPVVFHVLHRGEAIGTGFNISDARIHDQLKVLNDDFARLNADAASTPAAFQGAAVNTRIQFCLAQRDPFCNPTTGITRTFTPIVKFCDRPSPSQVTHADRIQMKSGASGGIDPWPSTQYLNIWVCNLGASLLGFGTFPGGPPAEDGIVLLNASVGGPLSPGTATPFHLGRTATHEIGHWLNLKHIWGDDGSACTGSDKVDDSPNQAGANGGCPTFPLTDGCTSTAPGVMFMNYMDYVDDACMNMFTQGQANRMYATFMDINSPRSGLLSSSGCIPPGSPQTPWAQDTQEDIGNETNNQSGNILWASEDVWIRHFDDDGLVHQNPQRDTLNYIYVRVRNSGCATWTGNLPVSVNWAKAGTGLSWPDNWNGSMTSPLMGDEVSSSPQMVTTIPAGGAVIVKFPWYPPNPNNYTMIPEPWHFCLVAHIGAPHVPETSSIWGNVKDNNNIIWRNISINHSPSAVMMRNAANVAATKSLVFQVPVIELGDPIFAHTTVTVRLSNALYNIWANGGKQGNAIQELPDHSIQILAHNAKIENLNLPPMAMERVVLNIQHTPVQVPEGVYSLDMIQYGNGTQAIPDGGERFVITSCDLNIPEPTNIFPVVSFTNPTCSVGNDGTATVDSVGYFQVIWAGPGFTSNLHHITGLAPGAYSVTATMPSGSSAATSFTMAQPSPHTLNLSTGRSADTQALLTPPNTDPNWALLSADSVAQTPYNAHVIAPHTGWDPAPAGSRWIAHDPNSVPFPQPGGTYTYGRDFVVSQVDPGMQLELIFLADDSGTVSINGQKVISNIYPAYQDTSYFLVPWTFFQTGTNHIEVKVGNKGQTPTGFVLSAVLTSCNGAQSLVNVAPSTSPSFGSSIIIFPNPTDNVLHITGLPANVKAQYRIIDPWGRVLLQSSAPDIDVQALAAGMYFLQISAAQGTKTVRFVKN
jgi:Pregnancy-associated plasma protein-A/Secretion system C-terminal sorting domain